ncbi:MAG: hypothetical protein JNK90_03895 [Planctomycetaceae bacterium]|nr:hypothetical protein [Planctomycetaceae bacterium]
MIAQNQANTILKRAFFNVCKYDEYLLRTNANERSVTHRFAVYIEQELANLDLDQRIDVDCEYNRYYEEPKRLLSFKRKLDSDDASGVIAYPDIIVHIRGTEANLIVIEVKLVGAARKCTLASDCSCDRCKLRAYKEDLKYEHAFFVTFPTGDGSAKLALLSIESLIERIS